MSKNTIFTFRIVGGVPSPLPEGWRLAGSPASVDSFCRGMTPDETIVRFSGQRYNTLVEDLIFKLASAIATSEGFFDPDTPLWNYLGIEAIP